MFEMSNELTVMSDSGKTYAVVADPRGDPVTIEEGVDGVFCTGDLLNIVPPPGEPVEGSLYEERFGDTGYEEKDMEKILEYTETLFEETGEEPFKDRYMNFLRDAETPFYTVFGNLDDPESYRHISERGLYMHIEDMSDVAGIDGVIPEVSGIPEDIFPVEIDENEFYEQARRKEGEILIAHSIPKGFEPEAYGFKAAFCSAGEHRKSSDAVHRLSSYKETGSYELVQLS